MRSQSSIGSIALAAIASVVVTTAAFAFDETKYPDFRGQWLRVGPGWYDPTKKSAKDEDPPLKPEFRAILDKSLADQASGGQGNDPTIKCIPSGMPRAMIVTQPMEIVVTEPTTYVMLELFGMLRRIYTDGRVWPQDMEPQFMGYSIGQWVDEDGDGRYDSLQVETRFLRPPHVYDNTGIPFSDDGKLVIKEKLYLDKANPNILRNQITTIDSSLTGPWTVTRSARRELKKISWSEYICNEDNHHVTIGNDNYMVNADGLLMPVRKDQPPPDLRFFQPRKQP